MTDDTLRAALRDVGRRWKASGVYDAMMDEATDVALAASATDEGPEDEGLHDLTDAETERLAEALRRADYLNWSAREVAEKIAGTVASLARPAVPALDVEYPRQEDFEQTIGDGLNTQFVADIIEPLESGEITLIARHLAIRCALLVRDARMFARPAVPALDVEARRRFVDFVRMWWAGPNGFPVVPAGSDAVRDEDFEDMERDLAKLGIRLAAFSSEAER